MRHSTSECRWSLEWLVESTTFWSILDFLTALFKFSYGDHTLSSFPFLKLCNSLPTLRGLPALTRMLLNQGLKLQEEYQFYSHQTFTGFMLHASHCSGPHSSHRQPVSSPHVVEDAFTPHTQEYPGLLAAWRERRSESANNWPLARISGSLALVPMWQESQNFLILA